MGRVLQLLKDTPPPQLPPSPKQPFVVASQSPVACPLRLRDEDRRPFDEAHRERKQRIRLLQVVENVREPRENERLRDVDVAHKL